VRAPRAVRWILAALTVGGAGCNACLDVRPEAYPCDPDAGDQTSQCAPGWRCGLIGRCHATGPDAGAPYACLSDLDCEANWRCSAAGICANPTSELLGNTYSGPLTMDLLNPLVLPGPPLLFATSSGRNGTEQVQAYFSLLDGGILDETLFTFPSDGGAVIRSDLQVPVGPATALAAPSTNRAYVLVDGGLLSVGLTGNGNWFIPLPGAVALRHVDPGGQAAVLIQDAGYLLAGALPSTVQSLTLGGACAEDQVQDLQMVLANVPPNSGFFGRQCLLAVSPSGVFYANYDTTAQFLAPSDGGTGVSPVPYWTQFTGLPGNGCGAPTAQETVQGLFPSYEGMGVALSDGGVSEAALVAFDGLTTDAGLWLGCTPGQPCCGRLGQVAIRPCAVCQGLRLAEVRPVVTTPTPVMSVRCVDDSAGHSYWFQISSGQVGGSCGEPFPLFSQASLFFDDVIYDAALPQAVTYAGAHGGIWLGSPNRPDETPYLLDEVPISFFETNAGIQASGLSRTFDSTGSNVEVQDFWTYAPGLGMLLSQQRVGTGEYVGAVQNEPAWAVQENLTTIDLDAPPGYEEVASPAQVFATSVPYTARVIATPDGGSELVVTSFDTLYSADVTVRVAGSNSPTPSRLRSRLVPLAGNPFQSLVLIPPDGGVLLDDDGNPVFARGYAVTQARLFEVTASSEQQWTANAIDVPTGQPQGLWREGDQVRLGLADGRVYSLPSLVPLAPGLPEIPPLASGFAQVCSEGFALGQAGVYRLLADPGGSGTGTWSPLDGGGIFSVDAFAPGGAIRAIGNHIYVATGYGQVLRFTAAAECN
jgi:hypothetical protein